MTDHHPDNCACTDCAPCPTCGLPLVAWDYPVCMCAPMPITDAEAGGWPASVRIPLHPSIDPHSDAFDAWDRRMAERRRAGGMTMREAVAEAYRWRDGRHASDAVVRREARKLRWVL